jgi:hypothetical protein
MNEIHLSVQGPEVTIMGATDKLQAFLAQMSVWKKSRGQHDCKLSNAGGSV